MKTGKNNEKINVFDFAAKLLQPALIGRLKEYVKWQRRIRSGEANAINEFPDFAPTSINLDLTTACDYACDHCIDHDLLNKPIKFIHEKLLSSLELMHKKGLESVILIGLGEPTLYPKFEEVVYFLKDRKIDVAIVSNGRCMRKSFLKRIDDVAKTLTSRDWMRISLDSGTDTTFQAMHKPKRPISLDEICNGVRTLKEKYPNLTIGSSYLITWEGICVNGKSITANIDEIVPAAKLAKRFRFNYITFKPFLERSSEYSEVLGISQLQEAQKIIEKIHENIQEAKKLETNNFEVHESNNLKVLYEDFRDYKKQPKNCHMTFLRGVLNPLGAFICPAYRGVKKARLGNKNAYSNKQNYKRASLKTAEKIMDFNASYECRKITCFYNPVNWFIEGLIKEGDIDKIKPIGTDKDFFF